MTFEYIDWKSMKSIYSALQDLEDIDSRADFYDESELEYIKEQQKYLRLKLYELAQIQESNANTLASKTDDIDSQKKAIELYKELIAMKLRTAQAYTYPEKIKNCQRTIERLTSGNKLTNSENKLTNSEKIKVNENTTKQNHSNLRLNIFMVILGAIILFMMMANDSKPKWSELSDKEKANAEWAYEVKQYQKEYEKKNKK